MLVEIAGCGFTIKLNGRYLGREICGTKNRCRYPLASSKAVLTFVLFFNKSEYSMMSHASERNRRPAIAQMIGSGGRGGRGGRGHSK